MSTTNSEHEPSATAKAAVKAGTPTLMEDAPLFAGLDDFVLIQTEKKKAEPPKAARPKKKSTAQQSPPATAVEPLPQKTPQPRKMQTSDPNAILLSVAEMCSLLKISRATLVRMDKSGKLPGRLKVGGSVRFHRETIEAWLKSLIAPTT